MTVFYLCSVDRWHNSAQSNQLLAWFRQQARLVWGDCSDASLSSVGINAWDGNIILCTYRFMLRLSEFHFQSKAILSDKRFQPSRTSQNFTAVEPFFEHWFLAEEFREIFDIKFYFLVFYEAYFGETNRALEKQFRSTKNVSWYLKLKFYTSNCNKYNVFILYLWFVAILFFDYKLRAKHLSNWCLVLNLMYPVII